jgi:hypothetical protein
MGPEIAHSSVEFRVRGTVYLPNAEAAPVRIAG